MKKEKIRVRFAPSPTGYLHLGGARTALFNWLFAKHHNGTFLLRIEDTDKTRSTKEAVQAIFDGMEWLGLTWDEGPKVEGKHGPYFQTERINIHQEFINKLVESGHAYKCYCSTEELDAERKKAAAEKQAPKYSGKCRHLSEEEKNKFIKEGRQPIIRFKMPEQGNTIVKDLVRGEVSFENNLLDDFVIQKSDGFPTYNFAAVIDDHLMEITHIIRGEDHLSNTPRQILLYQAFGFELPIFAHLPMILGSDKARLSKRHGATSVIVYKELGYLPEAMLNYLARLGWAHGDQEVFTIDELIKLFTIEKVGKTGAIFDLEKLKWLNGLYIRELSLEKLLEHSLPYLTQAFPEFNKIDKKYAYKVLKALQERIKLFPEVVELSDYFFSDSFNYNQEAKEKYLNSDSIKILTALKEKLNNTNKFTKAELEPIFKGLAKELNVKLGIIIHPSRLALTGKMVSPGIYDVLEILGKEKSISRICKFIATS